jgi:hypothetical protein
MNTKAVLSPRWLGNDLGGTLTTVNMRLKRLRRERHLVERAITALTEISRVRELRDRRAIRN